MSHQASNASRRYTLVLEELAAVPVDALRQDLQTVQADLASARADLERATNTVVKLEREEQLVAQMLRLKQWADDGVSGARDAVAALGDRVEIATEATLSANVLAVVHQTPGPLLPAEVERRLEGVGVTASGAAVRTALRRWVERGEIEKIGQRYLAVQRPGVGV